ncbi:MAG: DUF309 domain-containing protein [Planctomycetia bacterium]|nr:DUF309 domain-containing protein [Planctomycetia bacterium]
MNRRLPPTRLLPAEPLPPYTFVPGQSPHPHSDPRGHSFGQPAVAPTPLDPLRWRACRPYLHAIDLFNLGYCWEAHEVWEGLWNAAGRRGPLADFLKALIKLAAAGVKVREGQAEGVRQHARRAAALLRGLGVAHCAGLDLEALAREADLLAEQPPDTVNELPGAPVFALVLQPQD